MVWPPFGTTTTCINIGRNCRRGHDCRKTVGINVGSTLGKVGKPEGSDKGETEGVTDVVLDGFVGGLVVFDGVTEGAMDTAVTFPEGAVVAL